MKRITSVGRFSSYIIIVIFLILTACTTQAAPQPMPISQPSSTSNSTPNPTYTRKPRPTATITATPLTGGTLTDDGPWFIYYKKDDLSYVVNQDGTGKTTFPIEAKENGSLFAEKSDAYNIVSFIDFGSGMLNETMYIISLPNMEVLQKLDLYSYASTHTVDTSQPAKFSLSSMHWSPDGRYMAFIAMMDGPSNDLYCYDAETNQITRLSSGDNQVAGIRWSPDSQWIIHEEVRLYVGYETQAVWAERPDGTDMRLLYRPEKTFGQSIFGWLDDNQFLSVGSSIANLENIRINNLANGSSTVLYAGPISHTLIYDPELKIIFFYPYFEDISNPDHNTLHMLTAADGNVTKLDNHNNSNYQYDRKGHFFYSSETCQTEEGIQGRQGLDLNGNKQCFVPYKSKLIHQSPDGKWFTDNQEGVCLHQGDKECVLEFGHRWFGAYWRSDSKGLFVQNNLVIYYIPLDTLTPILIEDHLDYRSHMEFLFWLGE